MCTLPVARSMSVTLRVKVEKGDFNAVRVLMAEVRRFEGNIPKRILDKAADKLIELLQLLCPERTGALKRSIKKTWGHNIVTVSVGDETAPYAYIAEEGARPHVILPRRGRALVFMKPTGEIVITKRVSHPGYPGRHFVRRAIENFLSRVIPDLLEDIKVEVEGLGRR